MKYALVFALALTVGGCGFGQAFSRELSAQLAEDVGSAVDKKLGDNFEGVGDALSGAMKSIPPPSSPITPLEGGLAALAALIVSNLARGTIRHYMDKREEKEDGS